MKDQKGPRALGGSPASLWLYVENSDALFNKAVSAGATVHMPMADQFWGDRAGALTDPAGYVWWVAAYGGLVAGRDEATRRGVLQAAAARSLAGSR